MTRIRRPVAFNRIDRWSIGLGVVLLGGAGFVLWLSQAMVAPPRPRIATSQRPMIGLTLRDGEGGARVLRAAGPSRESGLRAGDRIVAIDDLERPSSEALGEHVRSQADGAVVRIEARRGPAGAGETAVLANVPVSVRPISPADFGLPYEDVSFRNVDGLTLRGWYIPPPSEGTGRAPGITYGHGNGTDRRHWLPLAPAVRDAGFAQVLFDFAGRGESDGEVITLGVHEARDLRAALDLLAARPEVDPLRLALAGRSMGAVAAIFEAADDARVRALVLDSPYASLQTLVDRQIGTFHLPAWLVRPLLFKVAGWRANYVPASVKPVEAIRAVKAPILLLHGDQDTVIPYEQCRELRDAATSKVTFVPLKGLGHNTPRPPEVQDTMTAFLAKTAGR